MDRVAVITGGSNGIGKATAELFALKGWQVYELSRSGAANGKVKHITADVTDPRQIEKAFQHIKEESGRLDVLVNNAGFGISGAVEATAVEMAKSQFDVNFFGQLVSIQSAIPLLRASGGGKIINLSSVAALFSIPFQAFYSASKSAVNSMTLALRNELKPFGIQVCAVMPGDVNTGFTKARQKNEEGSELYGKIITKSVEVMERDERNGMSPEAIASLIYKLSQKRRVKPLYAAGIQYKLFVVLGKLLPAGLANSAIGMLYVKK